MVINGNNNFAPSLFRSSWSLCEFVGDCFGSRYFSSGAALPQKNTSVQNNHLRFHTMISKQMVRSYYCLNNCFAYNVYDKIWGKQCCNYGLHGKKYTVVGIPDAIYYNPRGALNFFQVVVCGPDFQSEGLRTNICLWIGGGLVNWKFPNFGVCELKISKFGASC